MKSTTIAAGLFVLAFAIETLKYAPAKAQPNGPLLIDCHPDANATPDRCAQRGCDWIPAPVPGAPSCIFPTDPKTMPGYDVIESDRSHGGAVNAKLRRRNTPSLFGDDFTELTLTVVLLSETHLRIRLTDAKDSRFDVSRVQRHMAAYYATQSTKLHVEIEDSLFDVKLQESPFGLLVSRRSSGAVLFDSRSIPGFTFANQYLQLSTRLASQNLYGLGENNHKQLRHSFNWTFWSFFNRDYPVDDTSQNEYGYHPFYLLLEPDGSANGFLFANTHAMNAKLQPDPIITFRTIGGMFELHLFAGPSPNEVVQQYAKLIGRPGMPPYWGLGYQLSRSGYANLTGLQRVYARNRDAKIPQDVQYIDIDYMQNYLDFTYNDQAFSGLPEFTNKMLQDGRHLVLIIDPGIADNNTAVASYKPLQRGLELNVFIKDARTKQPLEGVVWPGKTYFPDFFNANATKYWSEMLQDFHQQLNFSGIWIDMNEISNFGDGSTTGCADNEINKPPYNPLTYASMTDRTICLDAIQAPADQYTMHNLYGYSEAIATNAALRRITPGQRPFVLSRSTFYGSGAYTAHWTGDNRSWWRQLKWSIVTCLEFNLFGIPWVGADICGYGGNAEEEMCVRWHQLGAFYPFSRNHNSGDRDQDPAAWSGSAVSAIRDALRLRYKFLPYLYTLFHYAHANGSAVMRPLLFEFATDAAVWSIDDQFLWGSSLMIAPVLEQGVVARNVYFPAGRWFHIDHFTEVAQRVRFFSGVGRNLNVSVPLSETAVFVRGGSILPWQEPKETTAESREGHFGLIVALSENQTASGSLFWDDGITLGTAMSKKFLLLQMNVTSTSESAGSLAIAKEHNGLAIISPTQQGISNLTILGIVFCPLTVQVQDKETWTVPESDIFCDLSKNLAILDLSSNPLSLNDPSVIQLIVSWSKNKSEATHTKH